jgi:hypothetical protein
VHPRILALLLLLCACNDTGVAPAVQELTATTEYNSYTTGETIRVSFRSSGDRTFQIAACCYSFACIIDVNDAGVWKEYEARGLPCLSLCPGIQLLVKPDETRVDSLTVNDAGTYRLRIPYSSPDKSPTVEVISNSFTVQPIR